MRYQEDFVLEKKYLNLIEKCIYNTKTDKFGTITGIDITSYGMRFMAYYDRMNSDAPVFFEDLENGKIRFIVIKDMDLPKKMQENYERETEEDIKLFFGDSFAEDMIMYVEEENRKEKNKENDKKEIKNISGELINLSKLSADIFYDNYEAMELYKKYTQGNLTEMELLYGICNYLCEEVKRLKDENLIYFIEKLRKEEAEFLVEYVSRKNEVEKKTENIIQDKERIFGILDKLHEAEEET